MADYLYHELPAYLTLSKGQRFDDLLLLQQPRLMKFYKDNPTKFKYDPLRSQVIYVGFDWVIP